MQKTSKAKHQLDAAELFAASPGCQMAYFSDQKFRFGYNLEGLAMEDVGICIICPFGQFVALW
jgi:hypothetical protein